MAGTDAVGGFMGGNDQAAATDQTAANAKATEESNAAIFKAIVEGSVSVGGTMVLSPMIMDMQKEMNKEET